MAAVTGSPRRPFSVLLGSLICGLVTAGCPLEDPAGLGSEGYLVALFPDDGAAAVPPEVVLAVELGSDLDLPVDLDVTLQRGGASPVPLACSPSVDERLLDCTTGTALQVDSTYVMTAEIPGEPDSRLVSRFSTGHPQGAGYELAEEMNVERLGGGSIAPPVLASAIVGGAPLLLVSENVFDHDDLPAVGTHFVWGPGRELVAPDSGVYAVVRDVGYPLASMTMIDDAGYIFGSSAHAYLPIWLDGGWHPVRVDDLVMRGLLRENDPGLHVAELTVEANVPEVSMDRILAQISGPEATLLGALVEMDTDTDLDGEPDAARLVMSTRAPAVVIQTP